MLLRMRAARGRPDEASPQHFESPFARERLRQLAASQGTESGILETLRLHPNVFCALAGTAAGSALQPSLCGLAGAAPKNENS